MSRLLDDEYLEWLYSQIGSVKTKDKSKTYWSLANQLFRKEFVWFVPNDDNRVEDGRDLRYEFLDTEQLTGVDRDWIHLGCSMLELLIGVARRLSFEADGTVRMWFWRIIENLDLQHYNDSVYTPDKQKHIDEVLDQVIWRTYTSSGDGGLFPLQYAGHDQREVEIWYQLCAYLLEHE
jgi:hypothetical protein